MTNLETLASWTVNTNEDYGAVDTREDYETVKVVRASRGNIFVRCRHIEWQGSVAEWQAALLAALSTPTYPRLTDWVRAQPSGVSLLAVFQKDEHHQAIERGACSGPMHFIRELELVETLASGRDYYAVWLSRHVDPSAEAKIPRGVKVYREL